MNLSSHAMFIGRRVYRCKIQIEVTQISSSRSQRFNWPINIFNRYTIEKSHGQGPYQKSINCYYHNQAVYLL